MSALPPWANGPFELLVHAEGHFQDGDDLDRRLALISFDDAVEVSVTTYLSLHPIQRSNRTYSSGDVERWLQSYHTKLDFLDHELRSRGMTWAVDRSHIVWAHDHRNEQYHGGRKGTPEKAVLELIRKAALWVFSVLFEVADAEQAMQQAVAGSAPAAPPQRDDHIDRAIDGVYGVVGLAGNEYYASELLFAADYNAYREVGQRLCNKQETAEPEAAQ